jgi:hypothetical protein
VDFFFFSGAEVPGSKAICAPRALPESDRCRFEPARFLPTAEEVLLTE